MNKINSSNGFGLSLKAECFFKVKMGEPNFYINKEKNTVTCKIPWKITFPSKNKWLDYFHYDNKNTGTAIGIAKCKEGDTFNPLIGKKVARAKAEIMAYKLARNNIMSLYNELYGQMNLARFFIEKAENVISHNSIYIKENF